MSEQCANDKEFLTYNEQIKKLRNKKLNIGNEDQVIEVLKATSYYSLVSGYKDIFKDSSTKDYKENVKFEDLLVLYKFDEELREIFLKYILKVERHIKSLYSYAFSEKYGEEQEAYMNANNYNYKYYQNEINELINKLRNIVSESGTRYAYIQHNIEKHNNIPLWVLVNTLTMGNMSKIYQFSKQNIQSSVSREFEHVYREELASMLSVLSKFRNVCAHNERLYNYKTKKTIKNLPIHLKIKAKGYPNTIGKCDLFAVVICLKYLLKESDFIKFFNSLQNIIEEQLRLIDDSYRNEVMTLMGFPVKWIELF